MKVSLVGAGGKMGMRLTKNLKNASQYEMSYLEVSKEGIERLKENLGALNVRFTEEELAQIRNRLPEKTAGSRY